jgi:hypothetical protein
MDGAPTLVGNTGPGGVPAADPSRRNLAAGAVRIESRTNLLFSFEKMALRDAVIPHAGSSALVLRLVNRLAHGCFWCSLRTLSKV